MLTKDEREPLNSLTRGGGEGFQTTPLQSADDTRGAAFSSLRNVVLQEKMSASEEGKGHDFPSGSLVWKWKWTAASLFPGAECCH